METQAYNPFSLINKKILITGASSGIGRAIAIECSKMGAILYINGRDLSKLEHTYSMLDGNGHEIIAADITKNDDINRINNDVPKLDGLVHSAGIIKIVPFKYLNRTDMDAIMNTNFFAPLELTKTLVKSNRLSKRASVVFISSIAAFIGMKGNGIYSASKGAINSIVNVLAVELAKNGIRVNAILPGMVWTDLIQNGSLSDQDLQQDAMKYPLGYGDAKDIAYAVTYFLSDASKWVTGCKFVIDGGISVC